MLRISAAVLGILALSASVACGDDEPFSDFDPCRADQITITQESFEPYEDAAIGVQFMSGIARFTHDALPGCTLREAERVELRDAAGEEIPVQVERRSTYRPVTRLMAPGSDIEYRYDWQNGCGRARQGPLRVMVVLPDDQGTLAWDVEGSTDASGNIIAPRCTDTEFPSVLLASEDFAAGNYSETERTPTPSP